jgi:hypothetical protein
MPCIKLDMGRYIEGKKQPKGYFDAISYKEAYNNDIETSVWEYKLDELWEYLTVGKLPVGVECKSPKLSFAQAKDLIWFLQEVTKIIPDQYAPCDVCKIIHHEDHLRYHETNGKHYCESCDEYAPVIRCEDCGSDAGYANKSYSKNMNYTSEKNVVRKGEKQKRNDSKPHLTREQHRYSQNDTGQCGGLLRYFATLLWSA